MGQILTLKDGSNHTVLNDEDLMYLVREYMGDEMADAMREMIENIYLDCDAEYVSELEKEIDGQKEKHKEVMLKLREAAEELAGEIRKQEQDRKKISNIAGTISCITGRELR